MKPTKLNYENALTKALRDMQIEQAVTTLKELASDKSTSTETRLRYHITEGNAGSLLRRMNPEAFVTGYHAWVRHFDRVTKIKQNRKKSL
jgi:hypothetical protein